jgi:protein-S-isoprenylcysteine O-methyltransferase Ste14
VIASFVIKIFFLIVILSFLAGMFVPMIIIKKKGYDPHGTHESVSFLTKLTPYTIFTWLTYFILYIILDEKILFFLGFDILISDFFVIMGFIIVSLGLLLDLWGTLSLGTNFRIELPKENISLITTGVYRLMRNPIVVGVYFLLLGSFLIIPTILSLVFLVTNILTFDSKVRDEERFLTKKFDNEYRDYREKVGRYLPFNIFKIRE